MGEDCKYQNSRLEANGPDSSFERANWVLWFPTEVDYWV